MIELKTSNLNRIKRALAHTGPITANLLHRDFLAMQRETVVHSLYHFEKLGLIEKVVGINWKKHPKYKLK